MRVSPAASTVASMHSLDPTTFLSHLVSESSRFRSVLAATDPDARVPACPDWTAADLLWHLGPEVQGFWAHVVRTRPEPPKDWSAPARPEAYADLLAAFDTAHADLVQALERADPADAAWTWSTEQTVGFTYRRQAHEALIHRIDAEQAAGAEIAPVDVALAADGVVETLGVMYGGCPPWGLFTGLPDHLRIDLTDAGPVWVQLGRFTGTDPDSDTSYDEPDIAVVADPGTPPDVIVTGAAVDLDLWLWRRGDDARIEVAGDRAVYDRFRDCVDNPIN